jgi:hypothetical protein
VRQPPVAQVQNNAPATTPTNVAGGLDITVQRTASGDQELVIPPQASIPAALASGAADSDGVSGSDGTAGAPISATATEGGASATAVDKIAEDFLNQVTPVTEGTSTSLNQWQDAAWEADERYRSLKGHDAFLRYKLDAAKESLSAAGNP